MIKNILFFGCLIFATTAYSQVIPAGNFAKDYTYLDAKLSPDGSKLGVTIKVEGLRRLLVLSLPEFKTIGGANFGVRGEVGDFHWVNNERIVIELWQRIAWLEEGQNYGELFALNYDGSDIELIYGINAGERQTGTRIGKKKATRGWANVIDILKDDDKHILISSTKMTKDQGILPTVHKLNVYSGKLGRMLTRAPVPFTQFITTENGELAFAVGTDKDLNRKSYRYNDKEWLEISNQVGDGFQPLALDDSGEQLFFIDDLNQDKEGLYSLHLETGERQSVFLDEMVDIGGVNFNADKSSVYALRIDNGFPTYVMFNDSGDEAKLFKSFLEAFPGYKVTILSRSKDHTKSILYVSNDIDAGSFYIFNSAKNNLKFLFANLSDLDANKMAQSTPINFPSFDETQIHGYITYPMNMGENEKVPLVTMVHGGPHGVRDYWSFDREVQMIAAQGYAVLRVNFRGSGGYGNDYLKSGYKQWGNAIQKDIITGTQWALQQGKIDPNKVCIMGGSFGGYSAVMSATLAPDLFKCVVANAGVYDLQMMYEEGDIPDKLYGRSYLDKAIGSDIENLREFSPVNNVEKLKAKLFIAHGERDRRVPFKQAEALRDALDKHNKPYEWYTKSTESHGFFDETNRKEYFEEVAEFLNKHLK
jgi:dipeptidyl aminopeptidase/acylaminoacyl peptidase